MTAPAVPVIDVAPLVTGSGDRAAVARQLDDACRAAGFFSVVGHGVPDELRSRLQRRGRAFFALPEEEKAEVAMSRGGRAWRGWFPVGGELTSGVPDLKEGLYLGAELGPDHPRVRAGVPLHGPNLLPDRPAGLGEVVSAYVEALTGLGHAVVAGLGLALGLDEGWFHWHLTADPVVLLRLFHYPAAPAGSRAGWGVAEHTDYGLLTILLQDDVGGLEVRTPAGWVAIPPTPGAFVCNLGDRLERMTGGRWRSTPHRVRPGPTSRLSVPFFFDPSWDAVVGPVPGAPAAAATGVRAAERWDGTSVHAFEGTYGEYLLAKVSKVFPELVGEVLGDEVSGDQVSGDEAPGAR